MVRRVDVDADVDPAVPTAALGAAAAVAAAAVVPRPPPPPPPPPASALLSNQRTKSRKTKSSSKVKSSSIVMMKRVLAREPIIHRGQQKRLALESTCQVTRPSTNSRPLLFHRKTSGGDGFCFARSPRIRRTLAGRL